MTRTTNFVFKNVLTVRKLKFGSSKAFLHSIVGKFYLKDSGTSAFALAFIVEDSGF